MQSTKELHKIEKEISYLQDLLKIASECGFTDIEEDILISLLDLNEQRAALTGAVALH